MKEPYRLRRERATVRAMVAMFCAHHHGTDGLCADCRELAEYADRLALLVDGALVAVGAHRERRPIGLNHLNRQRRGRHHC